MSTPTVQNDEQTPLLDVAHIDNRDVYDRFSKERKAGIVALVSWCGLMPRTCFSDYVALC